MAHFILFVLPFCSNLLFYAVLLTDGFQISVLYSPLDWIDSFALHSQKRGDDIKFFKIDLCDASVGAKKLCANAHGKMSILQNIFTKFGMQVQV